MAGPAETRYAQSGDLSIAYQVHGHGDIDLVMVPGIVSHVEALHDFPGYTEYINRLGTFARVITFDKRGQGLSDRVSDAPSLEERMDDVRAVMDAAGSERAVLFGSSEGGPMSILFAATYPERTSALILYETFARFVEGPEWHGMPLADFEQMVDTWVSNWGTGSVGVELSPSFADSPQAREQFARYQRLSSTPGALRKLWEMIAAIDVRAVLPSIQVPTLVLHGARSVFPLATGQYLARKIPGAELKVFEATDHAAWLSPADEVVPAVEEFLTGSHRSHLELDRTLATVMFTDVVGSTEHAVERGDRQWRELLDRQDAIAATTVARYRGRLVKTMGDGLLATFDGPARAIQAACDIRDHMRNHGLELRAGLHIGEVEIRGDDIGGIAVHVASRIESAATPGEVLVSRTVVDLVAGSGLGFVDRGEHELKGVPGTTRLFAVA